MKAGFSSADHETARESALAAFGFDKRSVAVANGELKALRSKTSEITIEDHRGLSRMIKTEPSRALGRMRNSAGDADGVPPEWLRSAWRVAQYHYVDQCITDLAEAVRNAICNEGK